MGNEPKSLSELCPTHDIGNECTVCTCEPSSELGDVDEIDELENGQCATCGEFPDILDGLEWTHGDSCHPCRISNAEKEAATITKQLDEVTKVKERYEH